jgi:hypothetical protein
MDTNRDVLYATLFSELAAEDKNKDGFIAIGLAGEVLRKCKKLCLTPF